MYTYMLQRLDSNYSVIHSLDGYDEISLTSNFKVSTIKGERIYTPAELSLTKCVESDLYGGSTIAEASELFDSVLQNRATKAQIDAVIANDAEGVGLFRSEFLYMDGNKLPTEDEQFEAYKKVVQGLQGKRVIIRTLDVGGDKEIPYLNITSSICRVYDIKERGDVL